MTVGARGALYLHIAHRRREAEFEFYGRPVRLGDAGEKAWDNGSPIEVGFQSTPPARGTTSGGNDPISAEINATIPASGVTATGYAITEFRAYGRYLLGELGDVFRPLCRF